MMLVTEDQIKKKEKILSLYREKEEETENDPVRFVERGVGKVKAYFQKSYPKLWEFLLDYGYLHPEDDDDDDDDDDDYDANDDLGREKSAGKRHIWTVTFAAFFALLSGFIALC